MSQDCERIQRGSDEKNRRKSLFELNQYNSDLRDMSLAVLSAMNENPDFRSLIKDESLKMMDGDYDVLINSIAQTKLNHSSMPLKCGEGNVKALLNFYLNSTSGQQRLKSSSSPLDELLALYPDLQIAVPVNAEKWDAEDYIPVVTFLPLEYDDLVTEELTGYTPDGDTIILDAVTPPDDPVIVVGLSERSVTAVAPGVSAQPPNPTNLSYVVTEAGICLIWTMPDTTNSTNTTGYYVFRQASGEELFTPLATVPGVNNRAYNDNNLVPEASYSYYVTSFFGSSVSLPSNIISATAPKLPRPVTSFDAIQNALNEVELRWQSDNSQYIQETRIYKYIIGVDPDYLLFGSFPATEYDTFDRNLTPGKKIVYKVQHVTSIGASTPKYDFVQAPYRDISKNSPVYIKQIKFTDWSLEQWPAGKPEFYISVANVGSDKKSAYTIQDQIDCQFNRKEKISQVFYGKKVLDWFPGFWYDMMTFTVLEYDRSINGMKFNIGVKFNLKDTLKLGFIEGDPGVQFEIEFEDKGEKCGNSYLNYFENPEMWMVFPNYGVQVRISEVDN